MNAFSSPTWLNAAISYAGNKNIESMRLDEQARLQEQRLTHERLEHALDRLNARMVANINAGSHVESAEIGAESRIQSAVIKSVGNVTRDGWKYFVGPAALSVNGKDSKSSKTGKDDKDSHNPKPPTTPPTPLQVELVDNSKEKARAEAEKKWKELFDSRNTVEFLKLAIPALVVTGASILSPMYIL